MIQFYQTLTTVFHREISQLQQGKIGSAGNRAIIHQTIVHSVGKTARTDLFSTPEFGKTLGERVEGGKQEGYAKPNM